MVNSSDREDIAERIKQMLLQQQMEERIAQAEEAHRRLAWMLELRQAVLQPSEKTAVTVTQSCSNCQYFLLLGDTKICNACKSPTEDITAVNECSDWVVKDEAEESKRNQELQARVQREFQERMLSEGRAHPLTEEEFRISIRRRIDDRNNSRPQTLAEAFNPENFPRWSAAEGEGNRRRCDQEELPPRHRWYAMHITLTELEILGRRLPPPRMRRVGEVIYLPIAAPVNARFDYNHSVYCKEVAFEIMEYGNGERRWQAWEYTGNLGSPIME